MSELAHAETCGEIKIATNMLLAVLKEIQSQGIKIIVYSDPTDPGNGCSFQLSKHNFASNKSVKLAFRLSDKTEVRDRRLEF